MRHQEKTISRLQHSVRCMQPESTLVTDHIGRTDFEAFQSGEAIRRYRITVTDCAKSLCRYWCYNNVVGNESCDLGPHVAHCER